MITLEEMSKQSGLKILFIGHSGTGKTTALGSLLTEGKFERVNIIDVDQGTDVLLHFLPKPLWNKAKINRISVSDMNSYADIKKALAESWGEGIGKLSDWGLETVLVIDSLNFLTKAALRHTLKMNGKDPNASAFDRALYGYMANIVMNDVLSPLLGPKVKCNIIITSHIDYREVEDSTGKNNIHAFPATEGAKIGKEIGTYFNNVWELTVGQKGDRIIKTTADTLTGRKCSAPNLVKPEETRSLGELMRIMLEAQNVA